jgi:hypothetical protein
LSREDRIAKNEVLFREVNERIDEVHQRGATTFRVVCECGDASCKEMLEVTSDEYRNVRAQPTHFIVIPGHEILDVEAVIESTANFNVVRKHVEEEDIARATH